MLTDIVSETKDAVLAHLAKFGEIVDSTEDEEAKSLLIQYKSRREAELAMLKGKAFSDGELHMVWHNTTAGDTTESEQDILTEETGLEEQDDLLDDYTPLDPTYLPPGLEEDNAKVDT